MFIRRKIFMFFTILFLITISLSSLRASAQFSSWMAKTIWESSYLSAVSTGDFDSTSLGEEIVVLNLFETFVAMLNLSESGDWVSTIMAHGLFYGVEVGDVDPTFSGNEVVVAGRVNGFGYAIMLRGAGPSWTYEVISCFEYGEFYDVAIGDFDPIHVGNEVAIGGFGTIIEAFTDGFGVWTVKSLVNMTDMGVFGIAIGDFDQSNAGNEIVAVRDDHRVIRLFRSGGSWLIGSLWSDDSVGYGVVVGDIEPNNPGDEVVVSGDRVTMLSGSGFNWVATTLWAYRARGLAIGDFYSQHLGNELVVTGEHKVVMIYGGRGAPWRTSEIWVNEEPFSFIDFPEWPTNVAVGNFDPSHEGNEVVVVDGDRLTFPGVGRVTMIAENVDTSPPNVFPLNPANGVNFSTSIITFSVLASDYESGIIKVELYIDNQLKGNMNVFSENTYTLTVPEISDGDHTWFAKAYNSVGLTSLTSVRTLTVYTMGQVGKGNLQIYVLDLNNNPVNGATVVSIVQPTGQLQLMGETDSDGRIFFGEIIAGLYVLEVNKSGYKTNTKNETVTSGQTTTDIIYLSLSSDQGNEYDYMPFYYIALLSLIATLVVLAAAAAKKRVRRHRF